MQKCDVTSSTTNWQDTLHVFETVPECYLIISSDLIILTASNEYLKTTFTKRESIIGKNILNVLSNTANSQEANGAENLNASLQQVLQTRKEHKMAIQQYYFAGAPADFNKKYWRTLNAPVLDEAGRLIYIIHKITDVTNRLELDNELGESKQFLKNETRRFKEAQAIGHTGSFEWTYPDEILYWSDEMYRIHGLEPRTENISLDESESFTHPEDFNKVWVAITSLLESKQLLDLVYRIIRKDGAIRYVRRISYTVKDERSTVLRVHGTVQDITEQVLADEKIKTSASDLKVAESKLGKLEENRFRDMVNAVIHAQEEERGRIAEALHNKFGQLLSIAKLKIPSEPGEASVLLNQAISDVRNISYELMPPVLGDFGLEFALNDMINKKLLNAHIKYKSSITGLEKRINRVMELAVYRIIQELLNNVVKYSKASFVEISVVMNGNISINLIDDGIGFLPDEKEKLNENGLGLTYITNRVHLLKGRIDLVPGLVRGTVISIELP